MKKHAIAIAIIGIIVVLAMTSTKVLNVQNIEENDRDIDSFHDWNPTIYTIVGILMVISAWWTFHFHFIPGMIQYGLGGTLTAYGVYLLLIQLGFL